MFHKREQGSHINALFSAWKGPQEAPQKKPCKMACGHGLASDRTAGSRVEHLVIRYCFLSHVFKINF